MILGAAIQQPRETLDYDFDYRDWFADTIDSIMEFRATCEPAGLDLVAIRISETLGKVWITGGEDGQTYLITVTAITTEGRIKEDEIELIMQDFK